MRLLVTCLLLHLAETWAHDQITLHDTHPLISYSPDTTCIPLPFHWWETCHRRHSPWALKDYQDRNTGLSQSYHVVSDRRNGAKGEGPREISFVLHGSPVAIYGAPPSVVGSPAAQEICIDDLVCHNLDVESAYLHAKDMDDRVLIWSGDIPNPNPQPHRIVIRMIGSSSLEAEPEKFMTLDRVIYTPDTGYESPRSYPLPAGATIKEISIEDTSRRIAYYGVEICTSWWWWRLLAGCSSTASPWEGKLFQVKAGSTAPWRPQIRTETYHQATTMFDVGKQDPQTQAIFNFKGSAVCVYGAPRSQITYPHGAQQVCLDEMCHYIDAHQLYLNIPHVTSSSRIFPAQLSTSNNVSSASSEALEDQPVLLWCAEGLDYTMRHRLVYKLVEPNPRYGPGDGGVRKGMTVAHIAYARVLRHSSFQNNERIMILFFALTSFFSLFMHLIRRCSRRSSKDFIDVSPNFTANSFSGRFGNERDPLVPNGIPSNSHHYSRIYRYGPAPPSKTSHCSAPGVSEHDRLSRVREAPSLPEPSRRGNFNNRNPEVDHLRDGRSLPEPSHRGNFNNRNPEVDHLRDGRSLPEPSRRGNFNNRNPEVDHLRVGRETPALSQPSHHGNRNSRNTSQTWCNFVPGRSHNDLPWRVPETPPPTHHGNRTNRNNLDASRSYTYRHPDDQQIQGGPNHVFPAFGTTSVPASAPDTRASGAPPPPYTRFPAS